MSTSREASKPNSPVVTLDGRKGLLAKDGHATNVSAELSLHRGDVTARTFPASALAFVPLSPSSLRRQQQHDKSSSPSANEVAANMKTEYVQWLVQIRRYERASMEQLLLLSCLVSGAEGIPRNFSALEEVVVAS